MLEAPMPESGNPAAPASAGSAEPIAATMPAGLKVASDAAAAASSAPAEKAGEAAEEEEEEDIWAEKSLRVCLGFGDGVFRKKPLPLRPSPVIETVRR